MQSSLVFWRASSNCANTMSTVYRHFRCGNQIQLVCYRRMYSFNIDYRNKYAHSKSHATGDSFYIHLFWYFSCGATRHTHTVVQRLLNLNFWITSLQANGQSPFFGNLTTTQPLMITLDNFAELIDSGTPSPTESGKLTRVYKYIFYVPWERFECMFGFATNGLDFDGLDVFIC